jgi:hypothetical protein
MSGYTPPPDYRGGGEAMPFPRLSIEATPTGVDRIVVVVEHGDNEGGLRLLRELLPGIIELDRHTRSQRARRVRAAASAGAGTPPLVPGAVR